MLLVRWWKQWCLYGQRRPAIALVLTLLLGIGLVAGLNWLEAATLRWQRGRIAARLAPKNDTPAPLLTYYRESPEAYHVLKDARWWGGEQYDDVGPKFYTFWQDCSLYLQLGTFDPTVEIAPKNEEGFAQIDVYTSDFHFTVVGESKYYPLMSETFLPAEFPNNERAAATPSAPTPPS